MVEKQIKYDLSDKETAWLVGTMYVPHVSTPANEASYVPPAQSCRL